MTEIVERLYQQFARYPLPTDLWVCEQCGPEWSAADIRATPLRSLSLLQLEAIHVMSLADDDFRHFFPRLIELLLSEKSPVIAFDLSRLKGRTSSWTPEESALVRRLVETLWRELLDCYPAELGYFSDSPTLIEFTDWCDVPLEPFLNHWQTLETSPAAEHLADLVDHTRTMRTPFEPAIKAEVLDWLNLRA